MSKLAKSFTPVPSGVEVKCTSGVVTISGKNGSISHNVPSNVNFEEKEGAFRFTSLDKSASAILGTLVAKARKSIKCVQNHFEQKVSLVGTAYKASVSGDFLVLGLGYSHPIFVEIPEGVSITSEKANLFTISSLDWEKVSNFADKIRSIRKPNPYSGAGVCLENYYIFRKQAKKKTK